LGPAWQLGYRPALEHHQDVWQHFCLRMKEKKETIPYLEDFHFHPRKLT